MKSVKIGFAPTRRSVFSAPDAIKHANIVRAKLDQLEIEYVDIVEFNEDGLLYDDNDVDKIANKFKEQHIDGLFIPHTNFGSEQACARLAKILNVPVLLWGPQDASPEEDGNRLRDSQCGLFATGKVLRRYKVPFTYMTNCHIDNDYFEQGINDFLAVCNTVKAFKSTRVLQIGPRPREFLTTMVNEGELLEQFGIEVIPVPISELVSCIKQVELHETDKVTEVYKYCKKCFKVKVSEEHLNMVAKLKIAMKHLANKYNCNSIVIQCWDTLQDEIGILPCAANSLLNDEGIPVICETDIHGAISVRLLEAAAMNQSKSMFADWTIRHPQNKNGELLQHCGPFPISLAKTKPEITSPIAFSAEGSVSFECKQGDLTLTRFDGDNGEYKLLFGSAKTIKGPYTKGTYSWIEVDNLNRLEHKIVTGPYIHHVAAIYENVIPILYEACNYLNIEVDLYDPIEEDIQAYLRGD